MELQNKQRWYNKTWGIVFFLIFFFPIGLYLMWRSSWNPKVKWIITGVLVVFLLRQIGESSNSEKSHVVSSPPTSVQEKEKPSKEPTQTIVPSMILKQQADTAVLSPWKKIKEAEDKIINYNALMAIQCEDILLNNNLGGIHGWSTSEPPAYDLWYIDWAKEIDSISNIPTNSKDYSLWKSLIDIDSKIINADVDVENNCDGFSNDPSLNANNLSQYVNSVQSDKTEINNLTTQRNSILKQLGY